MTSNTGKPTTSTTLSRRVSPSPSGAESKLPIPTYTPTTNAEQRHQDLLRLRPRRNQWQRPSVVGRLLRRRDPGPEQQILPPDPLPHGQRNQHRNLRPAPQRLPLLDDL